MNEHAILRIVFRSILLLILLIVVLWFLWSVRAVLVLVLIAGVLAMGLSPAVDVLSGQEGRRAFLLMPRAVAVLLIYVTIVLGLALIFVGIVPPLVSQTEAFLQHMPAYLDAARQELRALGDSYEFLQGLDVRAAQVLQDSLGGLGGALSQAPQVISVAVGLFSGAFSVLIVFVLTLYLIVDSGGMRRSLMGLVPPENRPLAEVTIDRIRRRIGNWLLGQILLSAIIGVAAFVGFLVIGLPYALLLAVITAVGELIPLVGPVLSAVPAVLVALTVSPLHALVTLILFIVIQQLENHLIVPQVMRRAIDLPPAVVIVALLMGAELQGLIGAVLALPVAAALSVIIQELTELRRAQPPAS